VIKYTRIVFRKETIIFDPRIFQMMTNQGT
jgi:hypothetical protein